MSHHDQQILSNNGTIWYRLSLVMIWATFLTQVINLVKPINQEDHHQSYRIKSWLNHWRQNVNRVKPFSPVPKHIIRLFNFNILTPFCTIMININKVRQFWRIHWQYKYGEHKLREISWGSRHMHIVVIRKNLHLFYQHILASKIIIILTIYFPV